MTQERWLITGGAGFIGAHVAETFLASGMEVILLDNLVSGSMHRIDYLKKKFNSQLSFVFADLNHPVEVEEVFTEFVFSGVVHTAGLKSVNESFAEPDLYMRSNLLATKSILHLTNKFGIKKFIFSSTAAVYSGEVVDSVIEDSSKVPISPYGLSKLMAEQELSLYNSIDGNQGTALRLFNVIGASSQALMDTSKENLVPILYDRILNHQQPVIFGHDYETIDGTCERDFVDVRDVAKAFLAVAKSKRKLPLSVNIGSGSCHSVLEVLNILKIYLDTLSLDPIFQDRRIGDLATIRANIDKARLFIGFEPTFTIEESLRDFCLYSLISEH
jgi:UDP-glucose 4-epimerase